MSVWSPVYLFHSLHYNPVQCYIFCGSHFPALAMGSPSIAFSIPLMCPHAVVFFWAVPCFLVLQAALGSTCIFPAPDWNQPFLQEPAFERQGAEIWSHPCWHRGCTVPSCPGRLGKSVGNTEEGHMWSCSLSPSFLRLRLLSGEPPTVI